MAKKNKNKDVSVEDLTNVPLKQLLKLSKEFMLEYGTETIENRALPDYRDGCKPVHRKILYETYSLGYNHNKSFAKSARIVGSVLGRLHPHSDVGVYGALVTMANSQEPPLNKHGNFGSPDGDSAAAMRYTETRLSKYADEYLLDPQYLAVTTMVDNYDGTTKEPIYLPSKLPNVLLMGTEGIAMGCNTLIPSFSKESVTKLVIKTLETKNKQCTPKMCMEHLEFKFPHGGSIYMEDSELLDYYKTGTGKLWFAPDVEVTDKGTLRVTSLAPRLKPSTIYDSGASIDDIKQCINISGKGCTDWAEFIPVREFPKKKLEKLVQTIQDKYATSLQCRTLVTERQEDGTTVVFKKTTVPGIVNDWVKWRLDFEIRVVKRLVNLEKEKIKKWDWLLWAVNNRDLVHKSWNTSSPDAMRKFLVKHGKITEEHAEFIGTLQVQRFTNLSKKELEDNISESKKYTKSLNNDISNKDNISKRIIKDLKSLVKE